MGLVMSTGGKKLGSHSSCARVVHVRETDDRAIIGGETSLTLKGILAVGDSFCHP